MSDAASWLDSPAVHPGGALAVEKRLALGAFDVVPGRLVAAKSGVHRYGLTGTHGVVLSAKVATRAFDPVVVLLAPSGRRWELPASGPALALPETGEYMLVVTSRENVTAGRALTNGEYRLTLLCDAPNEAPAKMAPSIPAPPPSSRSGRFAAWESEPR